MKIIKIPEDSVVSKKGLQKQLEMKLKNKKADIFEC